MVQVDYPCSLQEKLKNSPNGCHSKDCSASRILNVVKENNDNKWLAAIGGLWPMWYFSNHHLVPFAHGRFHQNENSSCSRSEISEKWFCFNA
ncbi:ANM_HP_G0101590.mRNA.1.CDS.1 [Saccharomyces cerevisiae]|nr:ANM_HP_G0101590.mRNA.1.CDS.1 [Saccharomyces cerevisiae]CAI6412841.1 ANM_HP_G0101590.mRNA.1.CDS.1 [Saccharomyces cerevisiae]